MSTKVIANSLLESFINGSESDRRATFKALLDSHASKAIAECDCQKHVDEEEEDEEEDEGKK